jgi:GINS complex subunit 3
MAELLAIREIVDLREPACYGRKIAAALKADPRSVDLRSQCSNFYTFALRYLEWVETDDLLQVVLDTFKSRVAKMADHAHNPTGAMAEGLEFLKGLDDYERQCKSYWFAAVMLISQYSSAAMIAQWQ